MDGQYFTNNTPVTGEFIGEIPRSNEKDLDLALNAVHQAKGQWGNTSVTDCANLRLKVVDLIEAGSERLAVVQRRDNGKPMRTILAAGLLLCVDHFHEPFGVVGQIIPWNFPLLMAVLKLAPA